MTMDTRSEFLRIAGTGAAASGLGVAGAPQSSRVGSVILGQDLHDADPDAIKEVAIIRTAVGGKTVYQRG